MSMSYNILTPCNRYNGCILVRSIKDIKNVFPHSDANILLQNSRNRTPLAWGLLKQSFTMALDQFIKLCTPPGTFMALPDCGPMWSMLRFAWHDTVCCPVYIQQPLLC